MPLVSNLFFFSFFLFLIYLNGKEIFKIKYFIILGILLSFSFTSFYYFFVIEVISFVLFLLYKYKFNINNLLKNKIKYYFISLVTLIILSLPFFIKYLPGRARFWRTYWYHQSYLRTKNNINRSFI